MTGADDDLVLQCQNGSPAAFETLVRKYQHMVHALTYRMTGSAADAEDLAQETFIRAYEQIGSFAGRARFATWLYSIAVHACLNWRRDEARRLRATANCAEEVFAEQRAANHSPAENELALRAQAALMALPAKQRAAIVLTIYEGLSHAEAAAILRCSETTVSWRVFAAKRKLKQLLSRRPGGGVEAARGPDPESGQADLRALPDSRDSSPRLLRIGENGGASQRDDPRKVEIRRSQTAATDEIRDSSPRLLRRMREEEARASG